MGLGDSRAADFGSCDGRSTGVTENRDIFLSRNGCLFSVLGESTGPLLVVALVDVGIGVTVELVAEADASWLLTC